MSKDYDKFYEVAMEAADISRKILTEHRDKYIRGNYEFDTKSDASPVTETDKKLERLITEKIRSNFPDHGILGEEYGESDIDKEYVWVIDPIDGTRQFIVGFPFYGTLISLCKKGKPILGVVEMPVMKERWSGMVGRESMVNGLPIRTRFNDNINTALAASSNTEFVIEEDKEAYYHLQETTKWRVYGGACYGYLSLAAGKLDLCYDSGIMREVDYCALVPIVEGAGGVMSDWEGKPLTMYSGKKVLASGSKELHEKVLSEIQKYSG